MSWTASAGATSYGIAVRDMTTNLLAVDTTTTSTSYTAILTAGRTYRWNVAAVNSAGMSPYTIPLYFTTPGGPPLPPTPENPIPGSINSPGPVMSSNMVVLYLEFVGWRNLVRHRCARSCYERPSRRRHDIEHELPG